MRQQAMVRCEQEFGSWVTDSRSVHRAVMAKTDKTLGFIQRDPVLDAIRQRIHHRAHVFGKPLRTVAVEPSAAMQKVEREIPVKQRDPRNRAAFQETIDQPVVEGDAVGIDRPCAGR